jgi:pimeloyl-ACP methyl ester carboxylesterase
LIICGKEDLLTPVKYSQYLKQKIKNSELYIIEEAGHMVMLEKPNEVNQIIERFLTS